MHQNLANVRAFKLVHQNKFTAILVFKHFNGERTKRLCAEKQN